MVAPFVTSWWSATFNLNLVGKSYDALHMLSNFSVMGMFSHASIISTLSSVLVNTGALRLAPSFSPSPAFDDGLLEAEEWRLLEPPFALELVLLSGVMDSDKSCNFGGISWQWAALIQHPLHLPSHGYPEAF
ncbi:hypothetical protein SLEP1_g39489 [Rubroshorea leprosula]|uniref:Uncharacterized protein n=1 Tax=Rubroshorea leprosula TaxID=152421 RepID=A0AAV5L0D6_9ROSI|nr:hypothetical protein SLEP1_g39489 [Rubroshorea leprosula]